tara:strand:- start:7109 stop:7555 length:447 start_codon:yes stop_codon:yes gene_type:complete
MKGFLVYHPTHGRHLFLDELYVARQHRRQGVAHSMLHAICKGPIELVVQHSNVAAIALYSALRFCTVDNGWYAPGQGELYMKTRSFKATRAQLATRQQHACTVSTWADVPPATRSRMLKSIEREHGVITRVARQILQVADPNVLYVIA